MHSDGGLARWSFGRVHLACSFECARDLDTKVAQHRRTRFLWVTVEKDVVAIRPQSWLAANEGPDLIEGWSPRRAHRTRRDLAAHRGQLASVNSLYVGGDRHSSMLKRNRDRMPDFINVSSGTSEE